MGISRRTRHRSEAHQAHPATFTPVSFRTSGAAAQGAPPGSLATTAMLRRSLQTLASVGARAHAQRAGCVGFQSAFHAPVFGTEERSSAADRVSHSRLAAAVAWRGACLQLPTGFGGPSFAALGVYRLESPAPAGIFASRGARRPSARGRPAFRVPPSRAHPGVFLERDPGPRRRVI